MRHKVLIFDTSIMCVWLRIRGKETCGPEDDPWNYDRVCGVIEDERDKGTTFVLPLATIIETGNHVTHAPGDKYEMARALHEVIVMSVEDTSPWAAFTEQGELWQSDGLKSLSERWSQETVHSGQSLGDASIVDVANYYYKRGFDVEILTGDSGLKAYQPTKIESRVPRRRR